MCIFRLSLLPKDSLKPINHVFDALSTVSVGLKIAKAGGVDVENIILRMVERVDWPLCRLLYLWSKSNLY